MVTKEQSFTKFSNSIYNYLITHLLVHCKNRLSNSNDQSQLSFLNGWLSTHFIDAQFALRKPIMVTEFGKSWKDGGYNTYQRDQLFNTVYYKIYASAKRGGAAGGALFWQLLTEGMESFQDGYGLMLGQSSSTANIIAQQSHKLYQIRKIYARMRNVQRWRRARAKRGRRIGN